MFSRFFVRRPVFAWVIAILIMLAGVLAIRTLPVGQYPDVAPPAVKISATYTGASAETLENSVTQVIEQQLTGLDHLLYFSSTSSSDGSVSITVTFEQGTDPDTAQVQVQNKVQQAESRLPSEVQQSGVTVEKSQSSFLLILAVYDKTNRATSSDISDWLVSNMQDPLARVEGVGSLQVFLPHRPPHPVQLVLGHLIVAAQHQQPLTLRPTDGRPRIGDEFAARHRHRPAGGHRTGNGDGMPPAGHLFRGVDVAADPGVGFLQRAGVVFLQPLAAVGGKAVGPPFLPGAVIGKAGFPAEFFHGIGKIDKGVFPLLGKIQHRDAVVGNVRPQNGKPRHGGCVIQQHSFSCAGCAATAPFYSMGLRPQTKFRFQ